MPVTAVDPTFDELIRKPILTEDQRIDIAGLLGIETIRMEVNKGYVIVTIPEVDIYTGGQGGQA